MTEHFDLIIIGTGSGNSIAGEAFHDKKIAIIERSTFGGTCINVGCIPTKMFVYPADIARTINEAAELGLHGHVDSVDWDTLQRRIFIDRIDPISVAGEEYRRGERTPNITFFHSDAAFSGEKEITITGSEDDPAATTVITGDDIVIATGSSTFVPPVIAESGVRYITNAEVMRLPELPKSMTILGGGVIAAEFAHVFSSLGTDVTVINRSPQLLRVLDADLSAQFTEVARESWTNHLGRTVDAARHEDNGDITLTLDDGTEVTSEQLLVAIGRTPNTADLNPAVAGIEVDKAGRIVTDANGRTTADGVWALGDATNRFQLKHVANAEARVVAHNLLRPESEWKTVNHRVVPGAIFTHPQIAFAGMTETQAREWAEENGTEITVATQKFGDIAYGWATEDKTGITKVIADANTGQILGAHLLGPQSSNLIQPLVAAMTFGIDARVFARNQYWPHPAMSEVVENALLKLEFNTLMPEEAQP